MAESETSFVSEANDSNADEHQLQTKRLSHAFSIEKILSVTSATTTEMCLRMTSEESVEPVNAGRGGDMTEDSGVVQYRHFSYGRGCEMTSVVSADSSVVSADSSSVGLRPGCCSDCEEDPELEVSLEEGTDEMTVRSSPGMTECGAEVSTTLTDGDSTEQGPQNGEFQMFGNESRT